MPSIRPQLNVHQLLVFTSIIEHVREMNINSCCLKLIYSYVNQTALNAVNSLRNIGCFFYATAVYFANIAQHLFLYNCK